MTWDTEEFNQLVQQQLSPHSISLFQPPLDSISWKFFLCRYHIAEANRILSEAITQVKEREPTKPLRVALMQLQGTDESWMLFTAYRLAEAHTIAFAQALHSTADMMAQVLCISLRLNRLFKP